MTDIGKIREYYRNDMVFATQHAMERFRQRGIKPLDIRCAVNNGEVIEQYPDDFPFPSCLIRGTDETGRILHICMSDEGSSSRIITAYVPDPEKWDETLTKRKKETAP